MKAKYNDQGKELICDVIDYYEGSGCCSLVKIENTEKLDDNEVYIETSSLILIKETNET